ncbi:MAG: hypothetical protein IT328_25225 [Caldilineaceae bacterium]|nr:hypothetical protein [Caldilineaceae bacterium]
MISLRSLQPRRLTGAATLLFIAMLCLGALWATPPLFAQSGITAPAPGASVSGDVVIMGTAVIDPFQKYELHYKLEPSGDDAYIYFFGATTPVMNGQLGVWQTGGMPPGTYSLRLRVVKNDGNYAEFYTQNISVNQGAAAEESPTPTATSSEPTATPIPTATFTPAPQPTVAVGQIAQPGLENVATPTPTPEVVAVVPDTASTGGQPVTTTLAAATNVNAESSGGSVTRELGEALSINRLRGQFFNGMRISAALFLGVIALYGGKRLFDWVWTQFS